MMYYSHDGGWWWLMAITSSIFWVALVVGVVALVMWMARSADHPTQQSARAILEQRFAGGEIDADEFQRRLRLLDGGQHGGQPA